MQTRRDIGEFIKFAGMIGIITLMCAVAASFICRSSVVSTKPDWSERQMVEMGR
jgi:hypothetical protein